MANENDQKEPVARDERAREGARGTRHRDDAELEQEVSAAREQREAEQRAAGHPTVEQEVEAAVLRTGIPNVALNEPFAGHYVDGGSRAMLEGDPSEVRKDHLDETVPGGRYIVMGQLVDAAGLPVD